MAHSEAARPLAELGSGARRKLGKLAAVDARRSLISYLGGPSTSVKEPRVPVLPTHGVVSA